jgi:long-chain acyl-CoA synthetase
MKSIGSVVEEDLLGDVMMFFLPLSHVGERVPGQFFRIYKGITGAYVNDITRILDDIKDIRPAFFGSVPRIFEKAYAKIMSEVENAPPLKKRLFFWADGIGRDVSKKKQKGETPGPVLGLKYAVANKLVFSKIREIFGGRCRYFLSASAPIAVEILEFFHACGMLILEGYGQTEVSCFCTLCSVDDYRFGSVGKPIPGASIKVAEDGEILVKGDIVFKGYLNQPELNRETLTEDGWIYTGDVGRIDEDGFLWITGRKKEIIITSAGKNITPSNIENILKNDPLIEHVMLHGDKRKYATALISLEPDNLKIWAEKEGYGTMGYEELVSLPALKERVQSSVDRTNSQVARFETIKKFALLPKPLEVETGELTPTMKVKRKIVETKYLHLLDELYE